MRLRTILLFLIGLCAFGTAATAQQPQRMANTLPEWWLAHVDFISRDGGTWRAPNPAGANDPNVPDAFGMEWRMANDRHVLIGRLYTIEGDRETEMWNFREFYHPGERRVIIEQWGGPGVYGRGETTAPAANRGQVEMTLWLPDGRDWREGHRNEENGDEYVTAAFDIGADGQWTPSGRYVWTRVRRGAAG
ncbi:MAG: hypothetical protein AB7O91_00865 [Sphingomonas sp.]